MQLVSAYASASATTPAAPPAPALSLTATGYKSRGQYYVNLNWNGANSVNVYRNGTRVTTLSNDNSFDDAVGKSGGTYTHKVCDTVTGACSNVTTTVL